MGVTAALAVFGSVLVASPASAVDDRISVDYWVTGPDTAYVCVSLNGDDELAYFPDLTTADPDDTITTDVEEALTIDTDNTGEIAEATIEYSGYDTEDCSDWEFSITDIYVGDWNDINFRFDAWVTDGDNDVWAEGSTDNHRYSQAYVDSPDWVYWRDTTEINDSSWSSVGLAHNNDYIFDERHAAFYCLNVDDWDWGWTYDDWDDINDQAYYWEDIVGDPIVWVYDLTDGEMVADNLGETEDITITDAYDEEYNFEHCGEDDREFWIEGLELGHTYEFQSQFRVETHFAYDESDSGWYANDYVSQIGFDTSVNFTPLDIRQNHVGTLPSDNDGRDGEYEYWSDSVELDGLSGWWTNWFQTGDAVEYEDDQYTNVDVILPDMQGEVDADYSNNNSISLDDVDSKWYVSDDWAGNGGWQYFEDYADFSLYDTYDNLWDDQWSSTCEVNGADVNDYDEEFWSDYADDWAGAGVCNGEYGDQWYYDRGNTDYYDDGLWGHLANFEGQAFVTMHNWEAASYDDANYYQDENDVLEGMSNSYSSNWDWDMQDDYVRATGSDSLQLSLSADAGYDYYCDNGDIMEALDVEESNATFQIRLLPNYGQDADYDSEDGYYENGSSETPWDNYAGNETYPESRLYAIDYTFEPGEYLYDGYSEYDCGGNEKAHVIFDLESVDQDEDGDLEPWETLQPGTTYSVQVMATFDRINNDDDNSNYGDGGYDFVSFSQYRNSYATTYLESHTEVLSETSAKFEVNLQDSHYTDRFNADQAGYLAWTECTDEIEWYDCSQYVTGFDSMQSFNLNQINRVVLNSDAEVEFIDGDKHFVFTRNDLNAHTKYQVVFGMDYYQTDNTLDDSNQASLRKEMEDTLDGTQCDNDGFGMLWHIWDVYEANGTGCYNGTSENSLYRTDVEDFFTFESLELDSIATVDNDAAQDGTDTNSSITLEFNKSVVAGSGLIQIIRTSDDQVFQTIRPSASQNVVIDGNVVTITPGKNFAYGTGYYVYVGENAFVDEDGLAFDGVNTNASTTFSTEEKPATLGTVSTKSAGNFKRTVTVDLKKSAAFETVQVWWHDHHSLKLMYAGSITLDENGNGDFTRVLPRLNKFDNVVVTLGRHVVARHIVATS
ncbi:MAG: hypothetical protein RLZZ330_178 [Actinomycetota bacterium]